MTTLLCGNGVLFVLHFGELFFEDGFGGAGWAGEGLFLIGDQVIHKDGVFVAGGEGFFFIVGIAVVGEGFAVRQAVVDLGGVVGDLLVAEFRAGGGDAVEEDLELLGGGGWCFTACML